MAPLLWGTGVLTLVAGPVLYPLWLVLRTSGRTPPAAPQEPSTWPALAVVVPAYREQSVIADKVADLHANGYPGALEVVVVADDAATAAAAARSATRVLAPGVRLGKSAALNLGVAAVEAPVVVLTDANTVLAPGSLARLARWFADPTVGAVAGEKRARAEGWYWRFESWLKRRETRLGTTVGLVGELAAVRRDSYRPLPTDVAVDDLWIALDMAEQGLRVVYEPAAVASELETPALGQVWERRTRVVAGALDVLVRRRAQLRGVPPVSAQLWGHRLLRMTVGPLAHVGLLAAAARRAGAHPHRAPLSAAFVVGHVLGAVAAVRVADGRSRTRVESLAGQVVLLQAVALGGLLRYLCGDRPSLWPKPERSRPLTVRDAP